MGGDPMDVRPSAGFWVGSSAVLLGLALGGMTLDDLVHHKPGGYGYSLVPLAAISVLAGLAMLLLTRHVVSDDRILRRLRWVEIGEHATMRPRLVQPILGYCISVVAIAQVVTTGTITPWLVVTGVGGATWATYMMFVRVTKLGFAGHTFVVEGGWLSTRLALDMADIVSFAAQPRPDGSYEIVAMRKANVPMPLPITLEAVQMRWRGMASLAFPAPPRYAELIAARLALMLHRARQT